MTRNFNDFHVFIRKMFEPQKCGERERERRGKRDKRD